MSKAPKIRTFRPAAGDVSPFQKGKNGKLQSGSTWGRNELNHFRVDIQPNCTLDDMIDSKSGIMPLGKIAGLIDRELGLPLDKIRYLPRSELDDKFYGQILLLEAKQEAFDEYEDEQSTLLLSSPPSPITPPVSSPPTTPPIGPVAVRVQQMAPPPTPIQIDRKFQPTSSSPQASLELTCKPIHSKFQISRTPAQLLQERDELPNLALENLSIGFNPSFKMVSAAATVFGIPDQTPEAFQLADDIAEETKFILSKSQALQVPPKVPEDLESERPESATVRLKHHLEKQVELTARFFLRILSVALKRAVATLKTNLE